MNRRTRWLRAVLVAMVALMVAACGATGDGGASPTAVTGGETPGDATPAGGDTTGGDTGAAECATVELQYWNPFTGPDGPFMGQMVDAFNSEHPNINVVMTTQSEYYTQLSTSAASNTLPDVAIVHADQVATQAFRNILRPMDDVVTAAGIDSADFPAGVWAAGEVAGTRYSIPLDIHPMTMFYNNDLLAAAGLDGPPTNGEEFEAAAAAMTADGNNGFLITTGFPIRQIFEMLLYQNGGASFNADGTEATWNSPEGVAALQWLLDAQSNYGQANLEVDAELNAFKGGTVGMIWNGIWQTTNVTGDGVGFDGQATAVPQIGPNPAVWGGSHQLTMPRTATQDPCKDAAAGEFISYLLANSVTWASAGQIPASNSVRASAEFAAVTPQSAIAPSVEGVFIPPSVPGITDAYVPLDEAVSAILAGTATDIQAALDDAAARGNQILEENRANYGDAPAPQ